MENFKFNTKALHTKYEKTDSYGSLRMPLYDSAAFEFENSMELEKAFTGEKPAHVYTRASNPTVKYLEDVIKNLTNAEGVVAFSSGMAAITTLFMALFKKGDNIVTSNHLFANSYSLFNTTLNPFGIEFKFVDFTDTKNVSDAIDDNTKAIFFETITNPQLEVANIASLSEIAKKHQLLLIADSTTTPPYMFDSKKQGIDLEVLSSTKFISGGGTAVGGILIDNGTFDWKNIEKFADFFPKFQKQTLIAKLRKEVHRNFGACLSPHNAYLQILGLETLTLRIDKACKNALEMADWLQTTLAEVTFVNYPGLKNSPDYKYSSEQFRYPGSILTFNLESKERCFDFMDKLTLIRRATNLNDNKSLIIHPASTIFCEFDENTLNQLGINPTSLRLSVGIEDVDDLKNDILKALQ